MNEGLLPIDLCNLDEAIQVFPFAVIALAKLISFTYPRLLYNLQRGTLVAFVCFLWGITFLDKRINPCGIAGKLTKISHDRLQNIRNNIYLNATVVMLELLQQALQLMTAVPYSQTMLILDDVLIPKPYAKCIQGAYWDHDHALDIPCFGIRVIVLVWSNGILNIPVAFLTWHKNQNPMPSFAPRRYRSKNDLARILIYWVYRKGLRFSVLTFDAWYSKEENLMLFNRLGIVWVTALAPNRHIRLPLATPRKNPRGKPTTHEKLRCEDLSARYPRRDQYSNYPALYFRAKTFGVDLTTSVRDLKLILVRDYIKSRSFEPEVALTKSAKHKKRHPNKYLLTNSRTASISWVIRCYKSRWQIEWVFRESKQHFALGSCSAVSFDAVMQHISFSFLGFVILQQLQNDTSCLVKNNQTLGEYRRELQHLYRIRMGTLVYLVNLSEQSESVDDILTDKILIEGLPDTNHKTKSDKPFTLVNDDKALSYLAFDKVA